MPQSTAPSFKGLKARSTIAWGKAPGNRISMECGLKARAKTLIPNKPFIEAHIILRKHGPHLRLKIAPLMVHRLSVDVPHQRGPIAQSDGERRIPALPAELRELRPLCLDPLRRRNLQPLHHSRNRFSSRQKQRHMNVIRNSTHPHAHVLRTTEYRRKIRVHLHADTVMDQRSTILRAEHQVHQNVGERLRHGRQYSAALHPSTQPSLTRINFIDLNRC